MRQELRMEIYSCLQKVGVALHKLTQSDEFVRLPPTNPLRLLTEHVDDIISGLLSDAIRGDEP